MDRIVTCITNEPGIYIVMNESKVHVADLSGVKVTKCINDLSFSNVYGQLLWSQTQTHISIPLHKKAVLVAMHEWSPLPHA